MVGRGSWLRLGRKVKVEVVECGADAVVPAGGASALAVVEDNKHTALVEHTSPCDVERSPLVSAKVAVGLNLR